MKISIPAMCRSNRLLLASILAAAVVLPARAPAAVFQLENDNSSSNATPPDNTTPCRTIAQAAADAGVSGGIASAEAAAQAQALGEDESCNQFARGSGNGTGRFLLVPQMAESPGDAVTVCLTAAGSIQLQTLGGGSASYVTDRISAVAGGVVQVALPPRAFSIQGDDERPDTFICRREITMRIGEHLDLAAGGTATAGINGISQSQALGSHEIRAEVGACPAEFQECAVVLDTPAFSPPGLAVLGLLLSACGGFVLRRRQQRTAN